MRKSLYSSKQYNIKMAQIEGKYGLDKKTVVSKVICRHPIAVSAWLLLIAGCTVAAAAAACAGGREETCRGRRVGGGCKRLREWRERHQSLSQGGQSGRQSGSRQVLPNIPYSFSCHPTQEFIEQRTEYHAMTIKLARVG
jgi:hypothetical protein